MASPQNDLLSILHKGLRFSLPQLAHCLQVIGSLSYSYIYLKDISNGAQCSTAT